MPTEIKMPMSLLQKIGDYLGTRPFNEVAQLINELGTAINAGLRPQPSQPQPKVEEKKGTEKAPK